MVIDTAKRTKEFAAPWQINKKDTTIRPTDSAGPLNRSIKFCTTLCTSSPEKLGTAALLGVVVRPVLLHYLTALVPAVEPG
ncbi:MAG TPA: hypothetical protein VE645_11605 [Pseudonocardiaceae bacterium]|nr:hypothetical protein [Pseudonocardiaceae bacterium]